MISRATFVKQAQSYIGLNEANGSFKKLIDIYNSIKPLPMGYKAKYTDAWCAITVSAVAYVCGLKDFVYECSCPRMISKLQAKGWWKEKTYKPKEGDLVFYDWNKDKVADHIGIIERLENNVLVVIEGNYNDSVKRRFIDMSHDYIRGYGAIPFEDIVNYVVNGIDYRYVYDYNYYISNNTDLKYFNEVDAFNHFIMYGMSECRQAKETFNVYTYLSNHIDLWNAFHLDIIAYYQHYCKYGHNEERITI